MRCQRLNPAYFEKAFCEKVCTPQTRTEWPLYNAQVHYKQYLPSWFASPQQSYPANTYLSTVGKKKPTSAVRLKQDLLSKLLARTVGLLRIMSTTPDTAIINDNGIYNTVSAMCYEGSRLDRRDRRNRRKCGAIKCLSLPALDNHTMTEPTNLNVLLKESSGILELAITFNTSSAGAATNHVITALNLLTTSCSTSNPDIGNADIVNPSCQQEKGKRRTRFIALESKSTARADQLG